jgi:hypothetical protein
MKLINKTNKSNRSSNVAFICYINIVVLQKDLTDEDANKIMRDVSKV